MVRLSDVRVADLFATLRAIVAPLRHPGVRLEFDEGHDVSVLRTDAFKLSQILRHFIVNALTFTEAGFVRVSARAVDDGEAVRFEVSDTGPGLSIDDQRHAFEEFVLLSSEGGGHARGTSAELLAGRLAASLGGEVAVRSTPGQGATFSVTVPVRYRGDGDVVDDD
jgi:signal transduction histidine kinase